METRCPKCNKTLPLTQSTVDQSASPEENTIAADGVNCSECGFIPFSINDERHRETEKFEELPAEQVIAHFRLLKTLGRGGFGTVYLAEDVSLQRRVALKVPIASRESLAMLLHEAQSAAKLRHPNIVSVYETGKSETGQAFIASEYIEGLNLRDVMTSDSLTQKKMVELLIIVVDALHHAHQVGIIHRDIKPANIMIDNQGIPYVADFGLAKQVSAEQSISSEGQVMGTANYMSPEQASGHTQLTDHRTDIYSVGVMLFQMLTGHLPFRGNVRAVIHQKTTQDAPSPRTLDQLIHRDLETICLKCLERDPDKRYSTALILKQELQRFSRGEPILARPIGPIEKVFRWSKRFPLVAGLTVGFVSSLIAGLIGVSLFWQHAVHNANLAQHALYRSMMTVASQHYQQGDVRSIKITLDRVAQDAELAKLRDYSWHFYERVADNFPVTVQQGDEVVSVAVSDGGRLLATTGREGQLTIWNGQTGEELHHSRPDKGRFTAVDFSPSRLHLAVASTNGDFTVWNPTKMDVPLKQIKHGPPVTGLTYAPDGQRLLTRGDWGAIRVWNLSDESLVAEIPSGVQGANVAVFSPDGTSVAIAGDEGKLRLWRIEDRMKQMEFQNMSGGHNESILDLCFSQDGQRIAIAGANGNYRIVDTTDGNIIKEQYTFLGKLGSIHFLKGDQLLAATGTVESMFIYDTETGNQVAAYPTHRLGAGLVSSSSDRTFLAIGSGDGTAKLMRLDHIRRPLIYWHSRPCRSLMFTQDSTAVLSQGSGGEILRFDLAAGEASQVVASGEEDFRSLTISPDQKWIIQSAPQPTIRLTENIPAAEKRVPKAITITVPHRAIEGVYCREDSTQMIACGRYGKLFIYDLNKPDTLLNEVPLQEGEVECFGGGRTNLAIGFNNRTVQIVDIPTMTITHTLQLDANPSALEFLGDVLVIGTASGNLEIHEIHIGTTTRRSIDGHGARITSIHAFPGGKTFATGSRDHFVKIWDLKSAELITTLHGHQRQIFSLAISPDGRTIASGGLEGDIRIWPSREE